MRAAKGTKHALQQHQHRSLSALSRRRLEVDFVEQEKAESIFGVTSQDQGAKNGNDSSSSNNNNNNHNSNNFMNKISRSSSFGRRKKSFGMRNSNSNSRNSKNNEINDFGADFNMNMNMNMNPDLGFDNVDADVEAPATATATATDTVTAAAVGTAMVQDDVVAVPSIEERPSFYFQTEFEESTQPCKNFGNLEQPPNNNNHDANNNDDNNDNNNNNGAQFARRYSNSTDTSTDLIFLPSDFHNINNINNLTQANNNNDNSNSHNRSNGTATNIAIDNIHEIQDIDDLRDEQELHHHLAHYRHRHAFRHSHHSHDPIGFVVDDDDDNDDASKSKSEEDDGSDYSERTDDVLAAAKSDTRVANHLRKIVIALFVYLAVFVPVVIYITTRRNQVEAFNTEFKALAAKIKDSFELQLARKIGAVDSFAIATTSHALDVNATWPFLTIPDYDLKAASALSLSDTLAINFMPIVTPQNRLQWENYTANNIHWLQLAQSRIDDPDYDTFPQHNYNHQHNTQDQLASIQTQTQKNDQYNSQPQQQQQNNGNRRHLQQQDQQQQDDNSIQPDFSLGFSRNIYRLDSNSDNGITVEPYIDNENSNNDDTSVYLPNWQVLPVNPSVVNYNAMSHQITRDALNVLIDTSQAVISRIENVDTSAATGQDQQFLNMYFSSLLQYHFQDDDLTYQGNPIATLFYPVFDQFSISKRKLVGVFSSIIYFQSFFSGILPPDSNGIICIIQNKCGDSFSFEIDGQGATYLGTGDYHDSDYDNLKDQFDFATVGESHQFPFIRTSISLNSQHCAYTLLVYPSDQLQRQHITTQPAIYAASVAAVIVVISLISLSYDCIVQRQMKRVLKSAKESRAIVSSLFPANVRDRLLQEEEERNQRSENGSSRRNSNEFNRRNSNDTNKPNRRSSIGIERIENITELFPFSTVMEGFAALAPPKMRLKNFLHEGPHYLLGDSNNNNNNSSSSNVNDEKNQNGEEDEEQRTQELILHAKPIADLFPHCTVLFADISGFTAWSSEREPEQVFTLLQTIFHTFDLLARKRGVFKVETIGDCYVAVTGLPDPQPDHAVRMTKFARACMQKISEVTTRLEVTLGPGTAELRMRFGLHSGPVTAGVLRGEKSRFQLFGDTVNTASRMESTGQSSRIQVSQATAQLLVEYGKGNWIHPREDIVVAKGKGAIQTYWVHTARRGGSNTKTMRKDLGALSKSAGKAMMDANSDVGSVQGSVVSENGSVWGDDDDDAGVFDLSPLSESEKYSRLIEWQVDLLVRLLKQVVAGRDSKSIKRLNDPSKVVQVGDTVMDEVSECIKLPKFDPKAAKARARPDSIELPKAAVDQLRDYIRIMAGKYRDNPFHNFAHASHVTMSANKLLSRIVKPEEINYHRKSVKAIASDLHDYTYGITSDPLTQFAVMFSALIHDVDHTGVSNAQLSKENPSLAAKYKSRSVAEQNSVDIAWGVLMDPAFKDLQQCIFSNESDLIRFRQLMVNLVMATDIFDKDMKATRNMRWEKVFHSDLTSPTTAAAAATTNALGNNINNNINSSSSVTTASSAPGNETTNLKATIVIEHIIQAADVAHTMQHWQVYKRWNERLFQEMYLAYESKRSDKDPSLGWYNGELWFFDNYVIPLAKKLEECGVFGVASDECLNYALENRREWAVKGKEMVKEMVRECKSMHNIGASIRSAAEEEIQQLEQPPMSTLFGDVTPKGIVESSSTDTPDNNDNKDNNKFAKFDSTTTTGMSSNGATAAIPTTTATAVPDLSTLSSAPPAQGEIMFVPKSNEIEQQHSSPVPKLTPLTFSPRNNAVSSSLTTTTTKTKPSYSSPVRASKRASAPARSILSSINSDILFVPKFNEMNSPKPAQPLSPKAVMVPKTTKRPRNVSPRPSNANSTPNSSNSNNKTMANAVKSPLSKDQNNASEYQPPLELPLTTSPSTAQSSLMYPSEQKQPTPNVAKQLHQQRSQSIYQQHQQQLQKTQQEQDSRRKSSVLLPDVDAMDTKESLKHRKSLLLPDVDDLDTTDAIQHRPSSVMSEVNKESNFAETLQHRKSALIPDVDELDTVETLKHHKSSLLPDIDELDLEFSSQAIQTSQPQDVVFIPPEEPPFVIPEEHDEEEDDDEQGECLQPQNVIESGNDENNNYNNATRTSTGENSMRLDSFFRATSSDEIVFEPTELEQSTSRGSFSGQMSFNDDSDSIVLA